MGSKRGLAVRGLATWLSRARTHAHYTPRVLPGGRVTFDQVVRAEDSCKSHADGIICSRTHIYLCRRNNPNMDYRTEISILLTKNASAQAHGTQVLLGQELGFAETRATRYSVNLPT